jgi:GGDEF domain-containing protein
MARWELLPMTELARPLQIEAQRAEYERLFDHETGMPRWALLLDRINVGLARAHRRNRTIVVVVIHEPRGFRNGPLAIGDLVEGLRDSLRADDTVARVASRTFVVVCNEIERDEDAATITERLLSEAGIVAHVGIALGEPNDDAGKMLNRAAAQAALGVGCGDPYLPSGDEPSLLNGGRRA